MAKFRTMRSMSPFKSRFTTRFTHQLTTGASIAEFWGTCIFVATVGLAVNNEQASPGMQGLCNGMILAVQVTSLGSVSGGHVNPAVSLGVYLTANNKFNLKTMLSYWTMQILGSVCGGLLAWGISTKTFTCGSDDVAWDIAQVLVGEVLYVVVLVFVVLTVILDSAGGTAGGLFIGLAVFCASITIGPNTGGCINPAITFGGVVAHAISTKTFEMKSFFLHFFGPFIGSFIASALFLVTRPEKYQGVKHQTGILKFFPPYKLDEPPPKECRIRNLDSEMSKRNSTEAMIEAKAGDTALEGMIFTQEEKIEDVKKEEI